MIMTNKRRLKMKKKVALSLVLAIMVGALVVAIFISGCNPNPPPSGGNTAKKIIEPLKDLVDYGQEKYYLNIPKASYSDSKLASETQKIADKQDESRGDFVENPSDWSNENYYAFDVPYFKDVEYTLENGGKEWVDDKTTTVTKIFCYADAPKIIERMSLAGIEEARMIKLVEYITRTDDNFKNKAKGNDARYPLTIGQGSAIFDYENLDEITDIRDNFKDYKDTPDGDTAFGKTEDEWEDLAKLKKRKIYGEIFKIFEEKADMFARFQMEYMTYQLQVVEETMIPAYLNEESNPRLGSSTYTESRIDSEKFKDYMRDEVFDYSMLSNFLAFAEITLPDVEGGIWRPTKKDIAMRVYGYTYQYQKAEYNVLDDAKYREYLSLGHKEYFEDNREALKYRDYDRKFYKEAYRYTADFYKKYYSAQFEFQSRQEDIDRSIYKGVGFENGIGYALNDRTKYTDEMLEGLKIGLESTLKLSDINYEYTGEDNNVIRYNAATREWKRLDENTQKIAQQKIKKVNMQIEQLKTQKYMLEHKSKKDSDLVYALQYQIKSYSADYISEMQSNKKTQVIQRKKLERLFAVLELEGFNYTYTEDIDEFKDQNPEVYHVNAVSEKIEDLGRTVAMYKNVTSNYSKSDVADQMTAASKNDWTGVARNITDTLNVDYKKYNDNWKYPQDHVDVYFEEKLIRKKYDCQTDATQDPEKCQISPSLKYDDNPNSHAHYVSKHGEGEIVYCQKVYDTEWALSRLLNAHEDVLRHMSGTVEINFRRIENFSKYYDDSKGWIPDSDNEPPTYLSSVIQKIAGHKVISQDYKEFEIVTLESGQEIGEIIKNDDGDDRQPSLTQDRLRGIEENSQMIDGKMTHSSQTNQYVFDAWCVDEELLYPVDPDDRFRFSIKLYPRYTVRNMTDPDTIGD